jgi:hypothetical protein
VRSHQEKKEPERKDFPAKINDNKNERKKLRTNYPFDSSKTNCESLEYGG